MSYVSSSSGAVNNGRYINWSNIGSLGVDDSRSLQVVAHIDGPVSGIESLTIELKLNLTEDAPENVLNCVEAAGIAGERLVSSSNCSYVESSWLPCCPSGIGVEKRAEIDSLDPAVVRYTITLKNSANSSMAAVVTDEIPGGMSLQQSSIAPYSSDSNHIIWSFADLKPGEVRIIR